MAADRRISGGSPWEPIIGYSRAVVAGEYVHVSGSTATVNGELLHRGDAYNQAKTAISVVIAAALREAGCCLEDVVRTRIYVANPSDIEAVGKAHGELFGDIRPASTMLAGIKFVDADMLVEIEADAWKRQ